MLMGNANGLLALCTRAHGTNHLIGAAPGMLAFKGSEKVTINVVRAIADTASPQSPAKTDLSDLSDLLEAVPTPAAREWVETRTEPVATTTKT